MQFECVSRPVDFSCNTQRAGSGLFQSVIKANRDATSSTSTSAGLTWIRTKAKRITQLHDLALQHFDALGLGSAHAFTQPGINLLALDPYQQGLRHATNLGRNRLHRSPKRWYSLRCFCTIRTARSRDSGENLFTYSWLHLRRGWSLLKNLGR